MAVIYMEHNRVHRDRRGKLYFRNLISVTEYMVIQMGDIILCSIE